MKLVIYMKKKPDICQGFMLASVFTAEEFCHLL